MLPNIENEFKRERTQDEIPQSGSGKTIMTVEPKFVPADGVEIKIKDTVSLKVRMVDCVGYIVDGALGHEEDGRQRLVSTPWSQEAMTFEKAAEIGTKKVIRDHSTIGIVILTDGSVTGIDRSSYVAPEERVINELKSLNKPFVVVLNTIDPYSQETDMLRAELEDKYDENGELRDFSEYDEKSAFLHKHISYCMTYRGNENDENGYYHTHYKNLMESIIEKFSSYTPTEYAKRKNR